MLRTLMRTTEHQVYYDFSSEEESICSYKRDVEKNGKFGWFIGVQLIKIEWLTAGTCCRTVHRIEANDATCFSPASCQSFLLFVIKIELCLLICSRKLVNVETIVEINRKIANECITAALILWGSFKASFVLKLVTLRKVASKWSSYFSICRGFTSKLTIWPIFCRTLHVRLLTTIFLQV